MGCWPGISSWNWSWNRSISLCSRRYVTVDFILVFFSGETGVYLPEVICFLAYFFNSEVFSIPPLVYNTASSGTSVYI